ncbi:WGR domain-containing protein [Usnea florida]
MDSRDRSVNSIRANKAPNTAPSSQTKEIASRARASADDACVFSAESNGVATDTYEVYVDDDGLNHDASFNLGNSDGNNNKFYYVQLLCRADTNRLKFAVWTSWGRVSEPGQNKLGINMSLEAALVLFKSRSKDKTGLRWENRGDVPKAKEYTMIGKSYGNETEHELEGQAEGTKRSIHKVAPPDWTLSQGSQEFIRFLFDTGHMKKFMAFQNITSTNYCLWASPREALSEKSKELADVILNPKLAQEKY